MSEGIRATVEFPTGTPCRIARLSGEIDGIIDTVWTSVATPDGAPSTSDFVVRGEAPPEEPGLEHVISVGDRHVLRVAHDGPAACPCECIGRFGCPVQRYLAQSGRLRLVFNATSFEQLQAVVGELNERFPDLDVRRLVRAPSADEATDAVFVDRGQLTGRQLEVLQTAYREGYFETPRRANATEIAATLDINPSTFAEHLASAQRKVFGDVLEEGD